MYKRAKKIQLFDSDGNKWMNEGVVNEVDELDQFNTVSEGYTIIQHDEVVGLVEEAVTDKKLNARTRIDELNNGARIHIDMTFPDITLDVENDGKKSELKVTYDNSYNGTTGLRLEVGAKSPYRGGFLWVGNIIRAIEEGYYHRHTKGVCLGAFEKKLDKSIDSFQNKIKDHFKGMFKTVMDDTRANSFLESAKDDKKFRGSIKYLKSIQDKLDTVTIRNKWQFYFLICDVISKETTTGTSRNIDLRNRQLGYIITRLHKVIPNTNF